MSANGCLLESGQPAWWKLVKWRRGTLTATKSLMAYLPCCGRLTQTGLLGEMTTVQLLLNICLMVMWWMGTVTGPAAVSRVCRSICESWSSCPFLLGIQRLHSSSESCLTRRAWSWVSCSCRVCYETRVSACVLVVPFPLVCESNPFLDQAPLRCSSRKPL